MPLATVRRVEVSPGHRNVKFLHDAAGKPGSFVFWGRDRADAEAIARAAVDRARLSPVERREDISVLEVLAAPFGLVAIVAGGLLLVLFVAFALSEGTPTFRWVSEEGERRRWNHWLVFLIPVALVLLFVLAVRLPARAWFAAGAVLLGSLTIWTAWRIVHRPQKLVWGGPIKA